MKKLHLGDDAVLAGEILKKGQSVQLCSFK
jgi:hypothetical protein